MKFVSHLKQLRVIVNFSNQVKNRLTSYICCNPSSNESGERTINVEINEPAEAPANRVTLERSS
jgi:hypothetical protein